MRPSYRRRRLPLVRVYAIGRTRRRMVISLILLCVVTFGLVGFKVLPAAVASASSSGTVEWDLHYQGGD